jgi:hypothetical protein
LQYWAQSYWNTDYWNESYWADLYDVANLVISSATVNATVTLNRATAGSLVASSASLSANVDLTFEDIGTPAELIAGYATVSVVAVSSNFVASGNLLGRSAVIAASVQHIRRGQGALQASSATVVGTADRLLPGGAVALQMRPATFSGLGERTVRNRTPQALLGRAASGSGIGERTVRGTGSLVASAATTPASAGTVAPADGSHLGTGVLQAGNAVVLTATQRNRVAQGALNAAAAAISAQFTPNTPSNIVADILGQSATISAQVTAEQIQSWDQADYEWGQAPLIHARDYPMLITDNIFFQGDVGGTFDREPVEVILERIGLTLLGRDRQGNWKVDPSKIKFIGGVWPVMRGLPGTQVRLYVGSQEHTEDPIEWEGPYLCTIGETNFVDFTVSGRYVGLRFESSGQEPWELISYDLELTTVGAR